MRSASRRQRVPLNDLKTGSAASKSSTAALTIRSLHTSGESRQSTRHSVPGVSRASACHTGFSSMQSLHFGPKSNLTNAVLCDAMISRIEAASSKAATMLSQF